jgi:hypothetical protein
MRTTARLLADFVAAVLVSCAALAASTSPPPNYQGLWWNAPAESESGWSINLEHHGDVIVATWFTYDATGNGWWLSMTADRTADGIYSGTLFESTGPTFGALPLDPAWVTRTAVGSGTLAFHDTDNGAFGYSVKGVRQTKSITRQVFGPLPTCTYMAQPEFAVATNYQDLWLEAGNANSPSGVNLTHQGDVIFATWFTYSNAGAPQWMAVTAPRIGPNVYSGQLIRTAGPAFDASPFDPAKVTRRVVGTATFSFSNGNAATFAYTLDGASRTKAITRHSLLAPTGTSCREKDAVTIKGKVFDGNLLERAFVCADVNGNARCDPGEAQVLTDATGAYELTPPAAFNGVLAAEVVAGQTRAVGQPGTSIDRSYRMASPAREYSMNITPFTTLVLLARERDVRLAEEMVRNELGLPSGFRINLDAPPAEGSLARVVVQSIVSALKDTGTALDFSATNALSRVVAAFPAALTEFPQLIIRTKDGAPIVSKEIYLDATFTLVYPAESLPRAELNGKIRGRGNTTWMQPKKPYKVQFANDASYAQIPDFLGMKKSRNWALLADYLDRSLMRNKLAFSLGNSSLFSEGMKWNPTGQNLEVYLNGEYVGLYMLTEDIRIDPARLNIRKMSTSPAVNDLDGGYLAEVDNPLDCYNDGIVSLQHQTPQGVRICIKNPDETAITPAQLAFIKNLLDTTERDFYSGGSLAGINPVSFADWYLLNELFRNQDAAFNSSIYLWKDTAAAVIPADRLLNMGPLWDFDISAGNISNYQNWSPEGCWVSRTQEFMTSWFPRLFDHPDFLNLTLARWKDKRPALQRFINASIETFARRLEVPQQRNFIRWQILGTPLWHDYEYYVFPTYAAQVDFLKWFLNERMAWLDRAFASPQAFDTLCR